MSPLIYPGGDEQETLNLGLATWGMDEVLAQNMIILDAAIGRGGGTPAGPTGAIQYNNAGVFGGTSAVTTTGSEFTISQSILSEAPLFTIFASTRPTPSGLPQDVVALFERDQYPNPAGCAIALIGGEDCTIRYGSTDGDFGISIASTGFLDYDCRVNATDLPPLFQAFRFVPMTVVADPRLPGRQFEQEILRLGPDSEAINDVGVVLPSYPLPVQQVFGTSTQQSSVPLFFETAIWTGSLAEVTGFVIQSVTSVSANNTFSLEISKIVSGGGSGIGTTYFELSSTGVFTFGSQASGALLTVDSETNTAQMTVGTTNAFPFILESNGNQTLAIGVNGHVGVGSGFNWATSPPQAPLHIADPSPPVIIERTGGNDTVQTWRVNNNNPGANVYVNYQAEDNNSAFATIGRILVTLDTGGLPPSGDMVFSTSTVNVGLAERMRLTATGAMQLAAVAASPTSAGTAGIAGQIVYFGGLLYFCSITGAAGSATWNKLNMTAV